MQMPNFDAEQSAALARVMENIPGAKSSKMFGMPAYKVKGKLAVAMFGSSVVFKVGAARTAELIGGGQAEPFAPQPNRVWKEWVRVDGDLTAYQALFEEAVRFVAENN